MRLVRDSFVRRFEQWLTRRAAWRFYRRRLRGLIVLAVVLIVVASMMLWSLALVVLDRIGILTILPEPVAVLMNLGFCGWIGLVVLAAIGLGTLIRRRLR